MKIQKKAGVKGVLLCSFTKSWFVLGCTRTCSHAWWFENRIIFHIIYIITTPLSPAWHKTTRLVPRFDEGPLSKKLNVLWLVSCPRELWLVNSWDGITAPPLARTASSQYFYNNSDPENIEQEDHAEPLHTDIARHINLVTLLLLFWLNQVLNRMSTTA